MDATAYTRIKVFIELIVSGRASSNDFARLTEAEQDFLLTLPLREPRVRQVYFRGDRGELEEIIIQALSGDSGTGGLGGCEEAQR